METHHGIDAVAIGRFDGMHLGHAALAERLGPRGALAVVDTLAQDLTPPEYLGRFTDVPFVRFGFADIRHLFPREFADLLREVFPDLRRVVVGEDFRFGCGRSGDVSTLRELFPGCVEAVPELALDAEPVRSSRIRHHISLGDMARANALLGREYRLYGRAASRSSIDAGPFRLPPSGEYPIRLEDGSGMRVDSRAVVAPDSPVLTMEADLEPGREYSLSFAGYRA